MAEQSQGKSQDQEVAEEGAAVPVAGVCGQSLSFCINKTPTEGREEKWREVGKWEMGRGRGGRGEREGEEKNFFPFWSEKKVLRIFQGYEQMLKL